MLEQKPTTSVTPQPTTIPTSTSAPPPPAAKCTKIAKYQDENQIIQHRYIVIFHGNTSSSYIQVFIEDLMTESSKPGSTMKVKNVKPLLNLKMFTGEMNMKAMEFVS